MAMAWAPPTAYTSSTPSRAHSPRIEGCGSPPYSACGGELTATDLTPATCAGTTFMITLEASGGQSAGDVQADPVDRDHPLADHGAVAQLDLGLGLAQLGATDDLTPADRFREGRPYVGGELVRRPVQRVRRNPERGGHDMIETLRPLAQGDQAVAGHLLADRPDLLDGGGHVEIGPRHDRGILQRLAGGPPATKIYHPEHAAILRSGPRETSRYLSRAERACDNRRSCFPASAPSST